jgi:hypothetical protein
MIIFLLEVWKEFKIFKFAFEEFLNFTKIVLLHLSNAFYRTILLEKHESYELPPFLLVLT